VNTSEKQAARTGALPVLTAVMAPDVPLEVVGEADTPTLTNEKRSLYFCCQKGVGGGKSGWGGQLTGSFPQCEQTNPVAQTRYRSYHPDP
jgi:hypothetical protein